MITTTQGQAAELAVAERLALQGYKILDHNWKTRVCEIDIVAQKDKVVYFVEVKFRAGAQQGSGLEHITPKKINQIKFAVRIWCQNNNWDGDCRVLGAEVSGLSYERIDIVELN